ncbi:MAG: thioredoxin domain-containing protein [Candidatus Zixiibacteriota bacterium]
MSDSPHANRLAAEHSPYLLQHANNPVDWYPWGPEAFAKARAEDKPIFLSIGYSTCHWCHVMEHESFEDTVVARLMNEAFVSIKVDREERPDIDNIYMTVCQMMTGGGGWPLTIIMTPDKIPFFAGTYFPKQSHGQRIGMLDLIPRVRDVWTNQREQVIRSANSVAEALAKGPTAQAGAFPPDSTLRVGFDQLSNRYDTLHGGFGNAPKFPTPHNYLFLLRYWKRSGDPRAMLMVENSLTRMRLGGMYDHVGFGFHRYSTDSVWLLPHFEKMLYDQAMLTLAYTEAFQATRKNLFQQVVEEVLTYVRRDMTDSGGGFYSAEDADSEGEEGKFYVWSEAELREILDKDDADFYMQLYGFQSDGNFRDQATGEKPGTNIPNLRQPLDEWARENGQDPAQVNARVDSIRQKLFDARETRIHPHKDDKILTDWNGLMIAAFAKAARVFDNESYLDAARHAAEFVLANLRRDDGRLLHRYRNGNAGIDATAEDYAFLIWGLLELYESSFDIDYLETAIQLNSDFIAHFWDESGGGFFLTADDSEELISRPKEVYDGAIPSANSVALLNLVRLERITANTELATRAQRLGEAFGQTIAQAPLAHAMMLVGLDFIIGPSREIVIAGDPAADDTRAMLNALWSRFEPNKVVVLRPPGAAPRIARIAAYAEPQNSIDGKATAYVCRNYACQLPTTDPAKMLELIAQ